MILTRPELTLQVHAKHMQEPSGGRGQSLEFSGEVRLGSEQGGRLNGVPAALVGESVRSGAQSQEEPGPSVAN